MIQISRCLARQFRVVLRRTLMAQETRPGWPLVLCQADASGLILQAAQGDLAVRYHHPGNQNVEALAFRGSVLTEFEGATKEPAVLEQATIGKGGVRWADGSVSRVFEFETVPPDSVPAFPALPRKLVSFPADFLRALDEATHSTAREAVRYGLTRLQLRGRKGDVVATDGRHLLVQSGFPFNWADDLLVPRLAVASCREVSFEGDVRVGRTEDHVAVQAGPWTFMLAIDKHNRFPNVESVIPRVGPGASKITLGREDAALLLGSLAKLPGKDNEHSPVTLDSGPPLAVLARVDPNSPASEVVLPNSSGAGPSVRVAVDRRNLR